ncbi:MAG: DNA-formamidopyrimidine glycosylase family protein [Candidatus Limnocylindrales bacterium]
MCCPASWGRESLAHDFHRLQSGPIPELPDLAIVAEAFHAALTGRRIGTSTSHAPLAVRGTPGELGDLVGRRVEAIRRRGKFLLVELDQGRIVFNPMLTGRFQLALPATKLPSKTALVLGFEPRDGPSPGDVASWTKGAGWLPAPVAPIEVRYRDPTQMGKVYLVPAGVERAIPGLDDELGPDADDPALTDAVWQARIRRHPGELKNLLKNQAFIAGIGNAYSDEILHAARLLPFRRRSTLAAEEVGALHVATGTTVANAILVLRQRVPPTFETQVRDFLAVHNKGGQACPRCGTRISQVSPGGFVTSFCRGCQR